VLAGAVAACGTPHAIEDMINPLRGAGLGSERLSALDASFLYLERPTERLHVGAVALLDGPVPFDAVVQTLGSRLGALKRYRQRPVRPFLDVVTPYWEDDPAFDPRRHVHRITLPAPGGDAELSGAVETLFARPLPDDRPLWETYVIEGLHGDRSAILSKVHHCMIDGVSGAQVLELMTDGAPASDGDAPEASAVAANADSLTAAALRTGARMLGAVRDLAGSASPASVLDAVRGAVAAAGMIAALVRDPVLPLPFNGTIGAKRRMVWSGFRLDDFLAMRGAAACKVNDVVLAVIAGALARYLHGGGDAQAPQRVRALIPVNVRRADEHLQLGNRVAAMFATLPVDLAEDPLARLRRIAAEMRGLKESGQTRGFEFVLGISGLVPAAMPLLARVNARWPLIHTVCTNVPGPAEARYVLGRRVLEIHPFLPLAVGIGLGFAIMSYDGTLSICATADADLVPDADRLGAALRDAEAELRARLGVAGAPSQPAVRPQAAAAGPTVADLMTPEVVTITPRERLARAWALMHERRIRHLPVVSHDGRLLGLVTHRDLLSAAGSSLISPTREARFRVLAWAHAEDVMETHVSTVAPTERAAAAGERMTAQKIGCLPVVGDDGRLCGIVTEEDFLRWATARMSAADAVAPVDRASEPAGYRAATAPVL
jgi:diacylglycerol O-acyltransferase